MFEAVRARLADVTALAGRIEPAARLSDMMARNQLPQVTPAAFVLPLGLRGGRADAAAGLFRQALTETVGVVLFVRSAGDATGARATEQLVPLRNAVIRRIVGWAPPSDWLANEQGGGETVGVFALSRGELLSMQAGMLTYQLDFALDDQLRI
jgi:hypothetical protein